jgi:hypothetical protein
MERSMMIIERIVSTQFIGFEAAGRLLIVPETGKDSPRRFVRFRGGEAALGVRVFMMQNMLWYGKKGNRIESKRISR